jgi:hypothetical protein
MSKDKAKVTKKVRQLERQPDDGLVIKPGRACTVERWLIHWLENIATPSVRYKPYIGYRTAVNRHLIPGLGAHRIDRIQPEHFEKLYARMLANGLQPGTAHQVHGPPVPPSARRSSAVTSPGIRSHWPSRHWSKMRKWIRSRPRRSRAS